MSFDTAVLFAGILAECVVLGLLLYRKVWRSLPIFSAYVAWSLATDTANYVLFTRFKDVYFHIYLPEMIPDAILQFAVLVELFWSVLKPIRKSLPRSSVFILGLIIAFAGLAIWPLAAGAVPATYSPRAQLFVHLQETISILRVVCFLVIACFSQLLSIGLRDRELQVATGLGFYSIISLIITVLHTHQSLGDSYQLMDRIGSLSYFGSLAYWVLSFSTKEQERQEFSPQMQQFLLQIGGGGRTGRKR